MTEFFRNLCNMLEDFFNPFTYHEVKISEQRLCDPIEWNIPPKVEFTPEEIKSLYQEGFTILEVAKMTGHTYYSVRKTLIPFGVIRKRVNIQVPTSKIYTRYVEPSE